METILLRVNAVALLLGSIGSAQAQAPAVSANQALGEVTAIDAQSKQISLKPDKGEPVTIVVGAATVFRQVPAGALDLTKAVRIAFTDLGAGDRILAIGQKSEDQKKIDARSVIVMTRSDLTQKQQREQEDWQKRGVSGTV